MLETKESIEELSQLMPTRSEEKVGIFALKKTLVKIKVLLEMAADRENRGRNAQQRRL